MRHINKNLKLFCNKYKFKVLNYNNFHGICAEKNVHFRPKEKLEPLGVGEIFIFRGLECSSFSTGSFINQNKEKK